MIFPEYIKNISPEDRVLEIGPGATPHPRSNVFLELEYTSEDERIAQSGHIGILQTDKEIIYYDGVKFPFSDNEFDYVICSHVIEHVEDPVLFVSELTRVAPKGYLEFPLIYYDYIYDLNEHLNFFFYDGQQLIWAPKTYFPLKQFRPVCEGFYKALTNGDNTHLQTHKKFYFQGVEWQNTVKLKKTDTILELCWPQGSYNFADDLRNKHFPEIDTVVKWLNFFAKITRSYLRNKKWLVSIYNLLSLRSKRKTSQLCIASSKNRRRKPQRSKGN